MVEVPLHIDDTEAGSALMMTDPRIVLSSKIERLDSERIRYDLNNIKVLGRGHSATVFLVNVLESDEPDEPDELGEPDKQVAVKVMDYDLGAWEEDPEFRENRNKLGFKEYILLDLLDHPNIVKVYELGLAGFEEFQRVFIVMEYIKGNTLGSKEGLKQFGELSLDMKLDILKQMASAVDFLHEKKIVHKDIKSSAFLLEYTEGAYRPVLHDLGLSKDQRFSDADETFEDLLFYGSAGYLNVGLEDDLFVRDKYAFAVSMFQLLTGELPFNSINFDIAYNLDGKLGKYPVKKIVRINKLVKTGDQTVFNYPSLIESVRSQYGEEKYLEINDYFFEMLVTKILEKSILEEYEFPTQVPSDHPIRNQDLTCAQIVADLEKILRK